LFWRVLGHRDVSVLGDDAELQCTVHAAHIEGTIVVPLAPHACHVPSSPHSQTAESAILDLQVYIESCISRLESAGG